MLSNKLVEAINNQINEEMFSAYLYLSMSTYFEDKGLSGFANWMNVQAKEEMFHATKFMNYLYDRGAKVELQAIGKPDNNWDSYKAIFEATLKHEQHITSKINELMTLAKEENDYASQALLQWYVEEQVEEESTADDLLNKISILGEKGQGIFMMDKDLSGRTFTPPASEE